VASLRIVEAWALRTVEVERRRFKRLLPHAVQIGVSVEAAAKLLNRMLT
jgi:hypothetical protein